MNITEPGLVQIVEEKTSEFTRITPNIIAIVATMRAPKLLPSN